MITGSGFYYRIFRDGAYQSVDLIHMTPAEISVVEQARPDWGDRLAQHLVELIESQSLKVRSNGTNLRYIVKNYNGYALVRALVEYIQSMDGMR
jgi:hypothetical protein